MAAHADEATLSRVARAIRRYSTSRAREAWAECAVTLDDFEREGAHDEPAARLCLECARLEFGENARETHWGPQCLTVDLLSACSPRAQSTVHGAPQNTSHDNDSPPVPDRLQRQIENFRAMRAAFGLSHFDLDCYVTNRRVMFSWRPLNSLNSQPELTAAQGD